MPALIVTVTAAALAAAGRRGIATLVLPALCGGLLYGALAARAPRAAVLADHPRGAAGPWQVRGHLGSDPRPAGAAWTVDLAVASIRVDGIWRDWPLRVRVTVYEAAAPSGWQAGSGFETFLALRPQRSPRNPLVAPRADPRAEGVDVRASLKSFRQLRRRARAPAAARGMAALRRALRRASAQRFGDDAPLVDALLLGERGRVSGTLSESLLRSGLIHLLAISGLHVGIVVGALFAALRGLGLARPHAAVAILPLLVPLHALVVPRPPVARACLMAAIVLAALASGRRAAALNGLALSSLLLSIADPWVTRSFGFQLSTAATGAILAFSGPPRAGGARRWPVTALTVSLVAQLAVAPLIARASFRLPWLAILLNVAAVPATGVALVSAPLALVAHALGLAAAADLAAAACRAALHTLQAIARGADALAAPLTVPAAALPWLAVAAPAALMSRAVAGTPGLGHRARLLRAALTALAACAALAAALAGAPAPLTGAFRLVAFDVGQGDALLLEVPGRALMIDTAGSVLGDFDPGTRILAPALRARGIDRLDAAVISHLDADHAGGLAGLAREIDIASVWSAPHDPASPAWLRLRAAAGSAPLRLMSRGAAGRWGAGRSAPQCSWRVLHPSAGGAPGRSSNDGSLVLQLRCGGRALLLTGDGERAAEAHYADAITVPAGGILKSPHHGSTTSSSAALLDAAAARHVVISVGWRNRFGLPDAGILARYRARQMAVYRTDRDGAVTLSAGSRVRVSAERWSAGRGRRRVGGWLY